MYSNIVAIEVYNRYTNRNQSVIKKCGPRQIIGSIFYCKENDTSKIFIQLMEKLKISSLLIFFFV